MIPCPDCRRWHDPTCPLARAVDAVVDADREWFLSRPDATHRHRPITDAEIREFVACGWASARLMTHVRVVQLRPGLRTRLPYNPFMAEAS